MSPVVKFSGSNITRFMSASPILRVAVLSCSLFCDVDTSLTS